MTLRSCDRAGSCHAQAGTNEASANHASTLGIQDSLQDLLNFNRWLDATTTGNQKLADLCERRFRPEFRPAFKAWLRQDPLNNPKAIASPRLIPQYKPANFAHERRFSVVGQQRFKAGEQATEHADDYIFATVFFATVLFFAGISMRFAWIPMRTMVLPLDAMCFLYGVVQLLTLPAY